MTSDNILKSDLLDILFEGKNKLYAAYELRRHYVSRMKKALAGTFTLIALLGFTILMTGKTNYNMALHQSVLDSVRLVQLPQEPKKTEKPKPQEPVKPKVATANPAAPIITPDKLLPETKMPDIAQIDTSAISTAIRSGDATTIQTVVYSDPVPTGGGTGTNIVAVIP